MTGRVYTPDAAAPAPDPAVLIPQVAASPAGSPQVDEAALRRLAQGVGARVRQELETVLLASDCQPALGRLQETGVLAAVLPEVDATVGLASEGGRHHKDVWAHTAQVVAQCPARPTVRWAGLLHDIGKVDTREFGADGTVTFLGHAEVGAAIFRDRIAGRLAFPRAQARDLEHLIGHHQRAGQYSPGWRDSAVRRFYREMGASLPDLLDLSRADVTSRIPGRRQEALRLIDELAQRIEALKEQDARVPPLPPSLGYAIMGRFGLARGPRIGRLRQALEQAVVAGEVEPHQQADHYLDYLERSGLLDKKAR